VQQQKVALVNRKDPTEQAAELLQRANEKLAEMQATIAANPKAPTPVEALVALQKLELYRIELEMQSEELYRTQVELDRNRACYFYIYENVPVGYCTLSEQGMILEGNQALAALLGETRESLERKQFTRFVSREDQDTYYLNRKQFLETGALQPCELRMLTREGPPIWVKLEATSTHDTAGAPISLVMVENLTERRQSATVKDNLWDQGQLAEPGQIQRGALAFRNRIAGFGLSKREVEVLRLVGRGLTSKQIAEALGIRLRTVDSHRQRIMQKLAIRNGPSLVRFVAGNGFDSDES